MMHFDSAPEPSLDPPPNVAIGNQRAGSGRVGFWVSHLLGKAIAGLRRHLMAPAVGVQGGREERAVMGGHLSSWRVPRGWPSEQMAPGGPHCNGASVLDRAPDTVGAATSSS